MGERQVIETCARSVASLAPAVMGLEAKGGHSDACAAAVNRGHFTPAEEDALRGWFARYLTARAGLLETIDELTPIAKAEPGAVDDETQVRAFVVGYAAAALLIRAARHFVTKIANHRIVQRKLNEPSAKHRYPRKQYTHIYHSMTSPANAWRLNEAMRFADEHRTVIHALQGDRQLGPVVEALLSAEDMLRVGVETYVKARLRYRWHSWRRRRASAFQQSLFWIAEAFGRVIAEVSNPYHESRATRALRKELNALLEPGDVLIAPA
jgi:hypothetical protein